MDDINAIQIKPVIQNSEKTHVCVGAILMKNNKFLFGKRNKRKKWGAGLWDIVGGRSLKNENPMYTLQRETLEETGIVIRDAVLLETLKVQEVKKNRTFQYYIFMVTHYKGRVTNCSEEHTKLKWFTREELDQVKLVIPEYLMLIDKWFKRIE